jgi:hypothetical protein
MRKAVAAMRSVSDPYVHSFVARTAALFYVSLGKADEAIAMAEESVDVARLAGLAMQEARSLTTVGAAYLSVQKARESLTAYLQALDV